MTNAQLQAPLQQNGFKAYFGFVGWSVFLTASVFVVWKIVNAVVRSGCVPNCEHIGYAIAIGLSIAAIYAVPVLVVTLTIGYFSWSALLKNGASSIIAALVCAAIATVTLVLTMSLTSNAFEVRNILRVFFNYYVIGAPISVFVAWRCL